MNRKILLSIAGLLVAAAGGFYYFTTTPTYSILEIRKALKEHDVALFEKHVDTEKLFSRMLDDVLAQQLAKSTATQGSGMSNMGAAFGMGLMQMIKPTLVTGLKSAAQRYVETGKMGKDGETSTAPAAPAMGNQNKVSLDGLASRFGIEEGKLADYQIEKQGKMAIVTIPYSVEGVDQPLQMKFSLQDQGGYWQVVQLSNAAELLEAIEQAKQLKVVQENKKFTEDLSSNAPAKDDIVWTVQLASKSDQSDAVLFVDRLNKAGYDAYFVNVEGMNRVYAGPVKGRENADLLRDRLSQKEHLSGFVVRYVEP